MKKKKAVLFPIEIKVRELPSKILLSLACARLGMRAYVGSKESMDDNLIPKLKSGIFFYKGWMKLEKTKKIKKKLGHFMILDVEIGPAAYFLRHMLKRRVLHPDTIALVDTIFVTGEKHKELAHEIYSKQDNEVLATGWPTIDLWRQEFLGTYQEQVDELKDRFGDYVLFASNFDDITSEKIANMEIKNSPPEWGGDSTLDELMLKYYEIKTSVFSEYMELLRLVAQKRPGLTFIIRPHPEDDQRKFRERLGDIPNIKILFEGEISPWLYGAKAVLHWGCTTGVQAAVAGIPSMIYKKPDWKLLSEDIPAFKVSKGAQTPQEVLNFIDSTSRTSAEDIRRQAQERLKMSISSLEGKFASAKIAKTLFTTDTKEIGCIPFSPAGKLKAEFTHLRRKIFRRLEHTFYRFMSGGGKAMHNKIPGGIPESEVRKTIDRLAPILNIDPKKISSRQVCRDLIEIELH